MTILQILDCIKCKWNTAMQNYFFTVSFVCNKSEKIKEFDSLSLVTKLTQCANWIWCSTLHIRPSPFHLFCTIVPAWKKWERTSGGWYVWYMGKLIWFLTTLYTPFFFSKFKFLRTLLGLVDQALSLLFLMSEWPSFK